MLPRIAEVANELASLNCDVIFAAGPYAIQALTKATATIPIVGMDLESDPIANGWVSSIGRPGGNLTGFFLDLPELGGKQIELLKEAVHGQTWLRAKFQPSGWTCNRRKHRLHPVAAALIMDY